MITKFNGFQASDGTPFLTRGDAQKHEIELLLRDHSTFPATVINGEPNGNSTRSEIAAFIINRKDDLLAILAARKPRTPKVKPGRRRRIGEVVSAAIRDME